MAKVHVLHSSGQRPWGVAAWNFAGWAGVALDWAALERVLATKVLGAKFPFVELNFSKKLYFGLFTCHKRKSHDSTSLR